MQCTSRFGAEAVPLHFVLHSSMLQHHCACWEEGAPIHTLINPTLSVASQLALSQTLLPALDDPGRIDLHLRIIISSWD